MVSYFFKFLTQFHNVVKGLDILRLKVSMLLNPF